MSEEAREQLEQTRGERIKVRDELAVLKSLQKHPGFVIVQAVAEENLKQLRNEYELVQCKGVDDLVARESTRGEISATRLWVGFVQMQIASLEASIELLDEQVTMEAEFVKDQENE